MKRIKIGDKVIVIADTTGRSKYIGKIVTITGYNKNFEFLYTSDLQDGGAVCFVRREIELIEKPKPVKYSKVVDYNKVISRPK